MDTLKLWFERDIRLLQWSEVEKRVDQPHVAEIRFSTDRFFATANRMPTLLPMNSPTGPGTHPA
jgi:hypothetical protein